MSQTKIADVFSIESSQIDSQIDSQNTRQLNTPNTRKRQRNYIDLEKHGLQGPPAPNSPTPAPKRVRKQNSKSSKIQQPS